MDYSEMTVAITGSARGIGKNMAERFARLGANVIISDINDELLLATNEELNAISQKVKPVVADVTKAADCDELVQAAVREFGRLDVMICNAGIVQVKPFLEVTAADWDKTFEVNVKGTFLTMQAAAKHMLQQSSIKNGRPNGKIINMASIAGRYASGPMAPIIPHYRASKSAVINLTHTGSYTFAPKVTVNAICPGLVATDMWKQIDQEWSEVEGWETGEAWKTRTSSVPLGRHQYPSDVAGLAEFLASESSDYITGQAINVDGGLTMG